MCSVCRICRGLPDGLAKRLNASSPVFARRGPTLVGFLRKHQLASEQQCHTMFMPLAGVVPASPLAPLEEYLSAAPTSALRRFHRLLCALPRLVRYC